MKEANQHAVMGFVLYLFIRLVCNSIEFCIYNPLSVQIGFILTVLLSLAVLLTIITDKIPSTSIEVSILCKANTLKGLNLHFKGFLHEFKQKKWVFQQPNSQVAASRLLHDKVVVKVDQWFGAEQWLLLTSSVICLILLKVDILHLC